MIKKTFYFLSICMAVMACSSKDNPDPSDDTERVAMLTNVGTNVIIPSFEAFQAASAELSTAAIAYAGDTKNLTKFQTLKYTWFNAALAWKTASVFTQGPIENEFLSSSIYFTTTNYTGIEKAISQPGRAIDNDYIESLGAPLKGIPAIEYLLFNDAGEGAVIGGYTGINGAARGNYLKALAENLKKQADNIVAKWKPGQGDYLKTFVAADGRDINSSFGILSNKMIDLVYTMKDERLGAPIGKRNNGTPQPNLVDGKLSGTSLPFLKAELQSVENAFTGKSLKGIDGKGIDDILDKSGAKSGEILLSKKIKDQIATVKAKLDLINSPLSTAVTAQKDLVGTAYDEVKKLQVMMEVDMINNLGVLLTFSDNDGD
jgi:predicted lipoprotein